MFGERISYFHTAPLKPTASVSKPQNPPTSVRKSKTARNNEMFCVHNSIVRVRGKTRQNKRLPPIRGDWLAGCAVRGNQTNKLPTHT